MKQLAGSFPDLVEPRPTRRQGIALIRPDGYIAYAARIGGGSAGLEPARALLALQTQ